LWKGTQILAKNEVLYEEAALKHIALLQQHEKAPSGNAIVVKQGLEDAQFWAAFGTPNANHYGGSLYNKSLEWGRLLIDVSLLLLFVYLYLN
jgi:hypothetical protein